MNQGSASTQSNPFATGAQLIEAERRAADLMYSLLTAPQQPAMVQLLEACFTLIERENGDALLASGMYRESKEFILSEKADTKIRLFYLLFLIAKEEKVQHLFKQACNPKHPGCLRGEQTMPFLEVFFKQLKEMAELTLNFNFNAINIVTTVESMVAEARRRYVLE